MSSAPDTPPATDGLAGRTALVTGGASGLGRATAVALAEAGANVVLADVDERGREVARELGGAFVPTDVRELEENVAAVAATVARFGGLDLAFLNAGVTTGCGIGDDFDQVAYRRAMAVNLDGVVFGVQACLPAMRERGGGAIVATSSLAGLTGVPTEPVYTANKHAVVGLVRSLGPMLPASHGVRINAVCPGFADTPIIEGIRDTLAEHDVPLIDPVDVARTVLGLFTGTASGECWFVQAGREPEPFGFRGIPGPRV